jgi:hypothetical protein
MSDRAPVTTDGAASPRDDRAIRAPGITLPKVGGAIRGIGEKFSANPVTGTGSMTVPIATSPVRSGFGPQLSLSYDSGAGNGPFGFGWSLSLPSAYALGTTAVILLLRPSGRSAPLDPSAQEVSEARGQWARRLLSYTLLWRG